MPFLKPMEPSVNRVIQKVNAAAVRAERAIPARAAAVSAARLAKERDAAR